MIEGLCVSLEVTMGDAEQGHNSGVKSTGFGLETTKKPVKGQ